MRYAFVVQLELKNNLPDELEGWVEEVDTGKELRFHSKSQLLSFLEECHRASSAGEAEPSGSQNEEEPIQ